MDSLNKLYDSLENPSKNLLAFRKERINLQKKFEKWYEKVLTSGTELAMKIGMNQKQLIALFDICYMLGTFKMIDYSEEVVEKYSLGNCGEQSNIALKKLLLQKIKNKEKIKIQSVRLKILDTKGKNSFIQDHEFILLNSNLEDVEIKNNIGATKKILDSINKGFYCDPWNRFYQKATVSKETKSLYSTEAGWDSVRVETIGLGLAKLHQLPLLAQEFVCKQLENIGQSAQEFFDIFCGDKIPSANARKMEL